MNTDEQLHLVPFQEAPEPPMTPEMRTACARALHVVTADGRILRAGRAALFVLERTTPGWERFALAVRHPPLVWGVEIGYWIVARNRRLISRLLNLRGGRDRNER